MLKPSYGMNVHLTMDARVSRTIASMQVWIMSVERRHGRGSAETVEALKDVVKILTMLLQQGGHIRATKRGHLQVTGKHQYTIKFVPGRTLDGRKDYVDGKYEVRFK